MCEEVDIHEYYGCDDDWFLLVMWEGDEVVREVEVGEDGGGVAQPGGGVVVYYEFEELYEVEDVEY